ncbi:acyl-coenzyme A thioesterase THEM4-like [Diadema antillarum]|uniref:acyl-coenzyme A thioesterase THEM4-like n=1 Tax=Diadema antillarum TaxID=105358 RepID=UPI003A8813A5
MSKVQSFSEEDLPGWTEASRDLYNQYTAKLVGEEGWKLVYTTVGRERNTGLFNLSHPKVGELFEYAAFFGEEEKKMVAIVQFGPKTEGPSGFVHGGAIGTSADICAGILLNEGAQVPSLTASLTVNYKRPIPNGSTVIIETKLDRVEGRKYFVTGTIKSPDDTTLFNTISAIFGMKYMASDCGSSSPDIVGSRRRHHSLSVGSSAVCWLLPLDTACYSVLLTRAARQTPSQLIITLSSSSLPGKAAFGSHSIPAVVRCSVIRDQLIL